MCNNSSKMSGGSQELQYGWIQVNSAVCPYVERDTEAGLQKLVPFCVLTEAASLRFRGLPRLVTASARDQDVLNGLCRSRARYSDVTFHEPTNLMTLEDLFAQCSCKVIITKLPLEPTQDAQKHPGNQETHHREPANLPAPAAPGWYRVPVSVPQSMTTQAVVPTVVAEYYSGESLVQGQTGQQRKDTHKVQNGDHHTSSQSPPVSTSVFQSLPVRGLQYVTLFHVQLLCVVKEERHYVSLADIHRSFFSRWPFTSFQFTLVNILRCPSFELSRVDVAAIRRLSGDAPSSGSVVSLADAEMSLPKVKVILRKLPPQVQASILKFTAQKKTATDASSKRIPRLSLIMEPGDGETGSKHPTSGSGGIGAKFGGGHSVASPTRYLKPQTRVSPAVTVKRLIEEKRRLAADLSRQRTAPDPNGGNTCTETSAVALGLHNFTPAAPGATCGDMASSHQPTPDTTRHHNEKGVKLRAVLEKLNKRKS